MLREWRERRRLSQLELSIQADISTRHLSFVETGRSRPTSAMILRLTEHLDVPLRERNTLLLAAGFAPAYPEGRLDGPQLEAVRASLRKVLTAHEPYPAVVVDRRWDVLDANGPLLRLAEGAAPELLEPPVNVLRLALHPDGLAPRIVNLGEWRAHLLTRLERQAAAIGDADLRALLEELRGYPGGTAGGRPGPQDVVVPLCIRAGEGELRFFSVTAVFGSPLDVTVAELAIESFFPADAATAEALRRL
ncbi:helix-turn-helix transcriptional regulator [Dactylosporangium roseum]|uniref:Helix-turn-helix transcriptional regulator n=2 Tax=Dactylosporangium roseum TaxID=47989 RepID=A0ABY5ZDK0_9ACTN|nr:helix-turn-helix transcriptional regulator [Dactylosporangium roseum]